MGVCPESLVFCNDVDSYEETKVRKNEMHNSIEIRSIVAVALLTFFYVALHRVPNKIWVDSVLFLHAPCPTQRLYPAWRRLHIRPFPLLLLFCCSYLNPFPNLFHWAWRTRAPPLSLSFIYRFAFCFVLSEQFQFVFLLLAENSFLSCQHRCTKMAR